MKTAGYKALAGIVERALRGGMMERQVVAGTLTVEMFDAVTVGAMVEMYDAEAGGGDGGDGGVDVGAQAEAFTEPQGPGVDLGPGLPKWPVKWRKPTAEILAAVKAASEKYEVPEEVIIAVIRKESGFNPKLKGYKNGTTDTTSKAYSKTFRNSYERNKGIKIPNSGGMRWGEKFAPTDWSAYGLTQTLLFNLYGPPGLFKASEPISAVYEVRRNVMAGARVLKILYDKYGTWEDAVWRYNGSKKYQREVFAFLETFRAAQVA
jgi:hypothetical protein